MVIVYNNQDIVFLHEKKCNKGIIKNTIEVTK